MYAHPLMIGCKDDDMQRWSEADPAQSQYYYWSQSVSVGEKVENLGRDTYEGVRYVHM